jgi:hypothetical protein
MFIYRTFCQQKKGDRLRYGMRSLLTYLQSSLDSNQKKGAIAFLQSKMRSDHHSESGF